MDKLGKLLVLFLQGLQAYREARDAAVAAGEVSADGVTVLSDEELVTLFQQDALAFQARIAEMQARYGAAEPPAGSEG